MLFFSRIKHCIAPVLLLPFLLAVCSTSCVTPKQLAYFQHDVPAATPSSNPFSIYPGYGDILYIQVNSLDTGAAAKRNPFLPISADLQAAPPANAVGYIVDKENKIHLPLVGTLSVAGESDRQLADTIQVRLQPYLKDPTVTVRFASISITVLGEVNKPATFYLNYYLVTLPQALGLAGDLTPYAQRNNILVIRQTRSQRTYARLDLTKASIINSPYYYLQPGDVVYVAPGKARAASVDRTYQILPIVLSSVGVIATVLGIVLR